MLMPHENNQNSADTVRVKTRTPLHLDQGVTAEIVSFNGLSDDKEHIALIYPAPQGSEDKTPLVRVHSECLTGDVFGSSHCDCGDQLHEAQSKMAAQGGILLYLRQEGRGIGLYSKIEAYKLQHDKGLDTFAANRHLGFADDLRDFSLAANMLKALDIKDIKLLTNNPEKVAHMEGCGVKVTERISTGYFEKEANAHYLRAKKDHGHRFSED